jgi:hypothetical protein
VSLFSEIEKTIERGFKRWTVKMFGEAESNELVMVHRAILEEIEGQVRTVARGRRVFPFARVTVIFASPDAARRALYQTAFENLQDEVQQALEAVGCEIPREFSAEVEAVEEGKEPFEIVYAAKPVESPAAAPMPATLVVVKGKAVQERYTIGKARTNIGRNADLTDSEQRVIRRNDVVFEEGADESNGTVSRKHAHIKFENDEYRLCDDSSEFGTRVFRDGRQIEVPAGNRRGEKLRPGDEIYLGRACLRFEQ